MGMLQVCPCTFKLLVIISDKCLYFKHMDFFFLFVICDETKILQATQDLNTVTTNKI